jgi:hypothetical protein
MQHGKIGMIPAAPRTDELPVLDESDECTEVFSATMLPPLEDRTSPSLPAIEVAALEPEPPTRPVPPLVPPRIPLPPVPVFPVATGVRPLPLPPPRRPSLGATAGLDFDDVTSVKPPVSHDDEASPIPLLRRKSNPPTPPISEVKVAARKRPSTGFFARLLSL